MAKLPVPTETKPLARRKGATLSNDWIERLRGGGYGDETRIGKVKGLGESNKATKRRRNRATERQFTKFVRSEKDGKS